MAIKRILKIKDSVMFGGSPNKSHWYLKYRNRNKVYYKQITHLYYKDNKRFSQLEQGTLVKNRISSFETPQGVYKKDYHASVKSTDIVNKRWVFVKRLKK